MLTDIPYGEIGYVIGALFISLSVHEAMHAFVAYRLGDNTAALEGRLTLNPLKHIDVLTTLLLPLIMMLLTLPPILIAKPVPFDPDQVRFEEYGSALVAIAGPVSNLILATIVALIIRGGLVTNSSIIHVLLIFITVNITLFVFNMLPIPPLDGSRLFYAFAPHPIQHFMAQVEAMGFLPLLLLLLILSQFIWPILANSSEALYKLLLA